MCGFLCRAINKRPCPPRHYSKPHRQFPIGHDPKQSSKSPKVIIHFEFRRLLIEGGRNQKISFEFNPPIDIASQHTDTKIRPEKKVPAKLNTASKLQIEDISIEAALCFSV